jgi:hypothetical protein
MNSDKIYKVMLDVLLHLHVCGICILADDNLNRLSRWVRTTTIFQVHTRQAGIYTGRKDKKASGMSLTR